MDVLRHAVGLFLVLLLCFFYSTCFFFYTISHMLSYFRKFVIKMIALDKNVSFPDLNGEYVFLEVCQALLLSGVLVYPVKLTCNETLREVFIRVYRL